MDGHVYFSVYNIYLNVYIPWVYNISPLGLVNHGQSWSTMVNHGQPCFIKSNMVIHGQSWSTMVEHHIVKNIVLI